MHQLPNILLLKALCQQVILMQTLIMNISQNVSLPLFRFYINLWYKYLGLVHASYGEGMFRHSQLTTANYSQNKYFSYYFGTAYMSRYLITKH